MAGTNWTGTWVGGRTFADRRGRTVYVLERQVEGKRRGISLGPVSLEVATAELALFERDPKGYRSRREAQEGAPEAGVAITATGIDGLLKALKQDGCGPEYLADTKRYLMEWREDLGGADLRTVKLKTLHEALDKRATCRSHRIAALKSYTRHLRDRGELETDATLLLHAPPPRAEKTVRPKGYDVDFIQRLYRGLQDQVARDVLRSRSFTGLHHSELKRLLEGKGYILPVAGHGEIAGTITLPHKNGDAHVQSVTAEVLAALQRLAARGACPDDRWFQRVCQKAADSLKLKVHFNPGELRHSFVTMGTTSSRRVLPKEGGLPISEVAAAVGHRNPRTTRKFYDGSLVPPMVVPPLVLFHPADPVELGAGRAPATGS